MHILNSSYSIMYNYIFPSPSLYVSDEALRHLRKECHHLKILDILSCVNVSKYEVSLIYITLLI